MAIITSSKRTSIGESCHADGALSHSHEGTDVLAPVSSVAEAAEAIAAGAQLVDAGSDEALVAAIRGAGIPVLDSTWLVYDGVGAAEDARRRGAAGGVDMAPDPVRGGVTPADRVLVRVRAGEVAAAVGAGWRPLVDVDSRTGMSDAGAEAARAEAARAGAIATVCAWQGARMIRTRHVTEVRRCLDMTETILGTRPPTLAVRGLA
jgi:hypothetical protein